MVSASVPTKAAPPIVLPRLLLLLAMALSVATIAALARWDSKRESASALDDFAGEQEVLATSVAAELGTRLALARLDVGVPVTPPQLLAGMAPVERPGESELLIRAPGSAGFLTASGRTLTSPRLARALDDSVRTLRLEHAEAEALGLPARLAIAGLSSIDAGQLGKWGIVVVATAFRERDREKRAAWRLYLAVFLATAVVGAFGGLALRLQRKVMQLLLGLAVAVAARERDERLDRLSHAATMLTMASGVAHEMGTPLGVIAGRAEQLLERSNGDERVARLSQAILDQTQNISEVVRGFLELARGGTPSLQQMAPGAVVRSALALVEHRFAQAGVQLTASIADDLPPIGCEPRLLEHALVNLLLNACDACKRGGHVELSAQRDAGCLRFSVVDDGSGISAGDAARVTEPFFTTKPAGKGTGLGLSLVSEIAKSHHGTLQLAQVEPRGTRASVQIPIAAGAAHA